MNSLTSVTPFLPVQASPVAPGSPPGGRDTVTGNAARAQNGAAFQGAGPLRPTGSAGDGETETDKKPSASARPGPEQSLSPEQLKQLTELKARDREVRAHEAAHQAVGGQYAGAISYTYQRGPDGAQYAVGGEVSIDVAPVGGDPQATIEKMRVVRAAALAPAEPSGQDRAVAAQAMQVMLQAQSELAADSGAQAEARPDSEVEPGGSVGPGERARNAYQSVSAMATEQQAERSGFVPVFA